MCLIQLILWKKERGRKDRKEIEREWMREERSKKGRRKRKYYKEMFNQSEKNIVLYNIGIYLTVSIYLHLLSGVVFAGFHHSKLTLLIPLLYSLKGSHQAQPTCNAWGIVLHLCKSEIYTQTLWNSFEWEIFF